MIGESEGDCVWRGSRRSVGSSFHRQGAAYWKKRLVILRVDRVGGRARVIIDEERVLQGWTEIKLWRYWGWFDVRTLYVRERSLYLKKTKQLYFLYDSNIYSTVSTFLTRFIFYHDTRKQYLSDLPGNRPKVIWRKQKKISKLSSTDVRHTYQIYHSSWW